MIALVAITIHLLVVNKGIRNLQISIVILAGLMLLLGFIVSGIFFITVEIGSTYD